MLKFAQSVAITAVLAVTPLANAQTVYKVGSTPTGVPFTFLDVKSNTIQGAMVDLITAIGEDAGFKVDVQPTPFSALIPSLTSNKIDIISAAMLITDARKEVIDFPTPCSPIPRAWWSTPTTVCRIRVSRT